MYYIPPDSYEETDIADDLISDVLEIRESWRNGSERIEYSYELACGRAAGSRRTKHQVISMVSAHERDCADCQACRR